MNNNIGDNISNKMKRIINVFFFALVLLAACSDDTIVEGQPEISERAASADVLPRLQVVGRYLKNEAGEIVNLHGFTQTYSPFFNNNAWNNYDVQGCLNYNKRMVNEILAAGWKLNFVRMHLDPYWSDDTNLPYVRYEGHERFSETRFRRYLDELFVPMAEYFISKGMYVVMRPPGVAPAHDPYQGIEVGDSYQQFLLKVWDIISQHPRLKNNSGIMFELANEPVNIKGTDGVYGSKGDACFANMKTYFQAIVNKVRSHCNNVIWVPGLGYQSSYAGYATHRIEGSNIGFAVHCYPGWYGSDAEQDSGEGIGTSTGGGYKTFQRGWDEQVGPVAAFAPIMVTEIDWAPTKYNATWGKSITGTAGAAGFGANFKYIADTSGNVSWLYFTTNSEDLATFRDVPGQPGNYTFQNDPEACPWAMYHWFKEYAEGGAGSPLALKAGIFNPSIWETGWFDEYSKTLVTGQYGFGGWQYTHGLDLSIYRTLTVELGNDNISGVSFRLFDKTSYWTSPATYDFGSSRRVVIDLHNMRDATGGWINPSHLYIIGFWSTGGKPIVIQNISLSK